MTRAPNVIDMDPAKQRLQASRTGAGRGDKRHHPRLESDDRLFVQVVLCSSDPGLVGTTISCDAVNLSMGGIQFHTHLEIPVGALLDLWVDIRSRPGKFFLAGEIRWVRPDAETDGGWIVGVQLKPGAATDIVEWREFHVQASAR